MSRLLWLGLGVLGGAWLASRGKEQPVKGATPGRESNRQQDEVRWASTMYGAGSASLTQPEMPLASTAFSAGTASLPFEQQAIRDPNTVR
jgi:hypothetical protein